MPLSSFLRLAELLRVKHATLRGTLRYICAQVAALKTLVRVASGPEAGLLGSGWVTILRCLSLLEALQVRRTCPEKLDSTCRACLLCCTHLADAATQRLGVLPQMCHPLAVWPAGGAKRCSTKAPAQPPGIRGAGCSAT